MRRSYKIAILSALILAVFLSYTIHSVFTSPAKVPVSSWKSDAKHLQMMAYHPGVKFVNMTSHGVSTQLAIVQTYDSYNNYSTDSVVSSGIEVYLTNESGKYLNPTIYLSNISTNDSRGPITVENGGSLYNGGLYYSYSLSMPINSGKYIVALNFTVNLVLEFGPYHFVAAQKQITEDLMLNATG